MTELSLFKQNFCDMTENSPSLTSYAKNNIHLINCFQQKDDE